MVLKKRFRLFDDSILDLHPDLAEALKPNDQYPELKQILRNRFEDLPAGSLNTKVIVNNGKIVERVFKTPMGQIVKLLSDRSNVVFDEVA